MIDCNVWKTEKFHECTNMGKVKLLKLWWQLYVTWLPVRDLENFRAMDFCSIECTMLSKQHTTCVFTVNSRLTPHHTHIDCQVVSWNCSIQSEMMSFVVCCVQSLHLQLVVTETYTGNILWQEDYWQSPQYRLAQTQLDNSDWSTDYLSHHKTFHSNQLHLLNSHAHSAVHILAAQ